MPPGSALGDEDMPYRRLQRCTGPWRPGGRSRHPRTPPCSPRDSGSNGKLKVVGDFVGLGHGEGLDKAREIFVDGLDGNFYV